MNASQLAAYQRLQAEYDMLKEKHARLILRCSWFERINRPLSEENDFLRLREGARIDPFWLNKELDRHAKMREPK